MILLFANSCRTIILTRNDLYPCRTFPLKICTLYQNYQPLPDKHRNFDTKVTVFLIYMVYLEVVNSEMKMPNGIVIFGANGCGKTTLGHELAKELNLKHIDVEDYYFDKSDIFYQHPHTKDDVIRKMLADIKRYGAFVFSGVTGDYGDEIVSMFKLGVFLSAPVNLRMERIRNRAIEKHGDRALPGGDIYEDRESFIKIAQTRNLAMINKWADTLTCPIVRIDSTKPISEIASSVMEAYHAL